MERSTAIVALASPRRALCNAGRDLGSRFLCQRQFRGKKRALAVQELEVGRCASGVAHVRKAKGFPQICDGVFLTNAHLVELFVPDQRIGNISKRALNGLLKWRW